MKVIRQLYVKNVIHMILKIVDHFIWEEIINIKENETIKNQTENYIILKSIAERFNKIANSIIDDEIKSLIKDEMRDQLKRINFSSQIEEIIYDYIDSNQEEVLDLYKKELKNKFR